MESALPRSTLRPCSWWARHRYVGASSTSSSVVSIGRSPNIPRTLSTASRPTGAETLTGIIRLAASAKYTAEPPSSSVTSPNGPSRVSRATEPTTSSPDEASGTAAGAAARCHDVSRVAQLVEKVRGVLEVLHLHPAPAQLLRGM